MSIIYQEIVAFRRGKAANSDDKVQDSCDMCRKLFTFIKGLVALKPHHPKLAVVSNEQGIAHGPE